MPNYIAIEIEDQKLLVASVRTTGRSYQINHLFEMDIEEGALGQQIGEALKIELSNRGLARTELIGMVGRKDAEIREMKVPPAPDDELPDLVRFQARNVFASLNDNWLFDYVPFERAEGEQQRVLAVAIPPQIKDQMDTIADAAGLKLKRIVFRPFALCDLFEGLLSGDDNRLLILPVNGRFEVMVTKGNQLAAARSFSASKSGDRDAVARHAVGEIRRTIASTKSSLGGSLQQVIVGGAKEEWLELEQAFKESSDLPIVFFAPLGCVEPSRFTATQMPERPERFAATVGALVNESKSAKHTVDFVNPRRPKVKKRDYRKILIPLAALGLIVLMGAGYGWYALNEQTKSIEEARNQLEKDRQLNADTDRLIGEVAALDTWMAGKVNWMDELAFISEKLLTPDDIIISKFRGVETSKGFQIALTSHVSIEQEDDNTWQESFGDRYKAPIFDQIDSVEVEAIKDHPVLRPFKLEQDLDVFGKVERINQLAKAKRDAEFESQSSSLTENSSEVSTESDREGQQ